MTDYVDPSKADPRHPDRPTHPDFVRLSNALQTTDARAEAGEPIADILGVDETSLLYVIDNRLTILGLSDNTMLKAVYVDAFTLGMRYAEARQ